MKKMLTLTATALFAVAAIAHDDRPAAAAASETHGHHEHGDADDIGVPGRAAQVARTVTVDMTDAMRFEPASISAKQGETLRVRVRNLGRLRHEFVLGSERELKEHEALMKRFPEMEHDDPNSVTVAPGETGEVIWKFTKAGRIDFACLQPGHYDAGMKGAVDVAAKKHASVGHRRRGDHAH